MKNLQSSVCQILRSLLLACFFYVPSCKTDPLTRILKDNGYAPVKPIRETQAIGDIYRDKKLRGQPVVLVADLKESDKASLPAVPQGSVALGSIAGDDAFSLNANADVIGYASGSLTAKHIAKFKVSFGVVREYTSSETNFKRRLEVIRKAMDDESSKAVDGCYAVVGLLQADSIEYEFYTQDGAKVDVETGSVVETAVKGALGGNWRANQQKNLSLNTPYYIGYKVARIVDKTAESGRRTKMPHELIGELFLPQSARQAVSSSVELKGVSARSLRADEDPLRTTMAVEWTEGGELPSLR